MQKDFPYDAKAEAQKHAKALLNMVGSWKRISGVHIPPEMEDRLRRIAEGGE